MHLRSKCHERGIDISKDKLDAYWLSKEEHKQFCNDKAGVKALALWANGTEVSRVIFESTGIYHRGIETGLADHDISFARVNPRQARRFCEGETFCAIGSSTLANGQLAKTDRVPSRDIGCANTLPVNGRCNAGPNGIIACVEGRSAKKRNAS